MIRGNDEKKSGPSSSTSEDPCIARPSSSSVLGPLSKTLRNPSPSVGDSSARSSSSSSKKVKPNKKKQKEKVASQDDIISEKTPGDEMPGSRKVLSENTQLQDQIQSHDHEGTQRCDDGPEINVWDEEKEQQLNDSESQEQVTEVISEDDKAAHMSNANAAYKGDKNILSRLSKVDKSTMKALRIFTLTGGDEEVAPVIETLLSEQSKMKTIIMEQAQEIAFQRRRIEELERRCSKEMKSRREQETKSEEERPPTEARHMPTYAVVVSSGSLEKDEVASLIRKKVDPLELGLQDVAMRN
ncbi:hypothetical protein HPB49_012425 [Dermacentor silvarum]|uniref:Uncharacterized protein n=1 Tax=Dermacentor silvarum TaxID=543639 RepID=A0ACB8CF98_DERSI|nr:hypothetical protein HPB49_012425 [Dermacentor silvarum]